MDIIPNVNEEADDPVRHVRKICLGTSVILREILQQFPNRELIKLSLVNKQWNFEARSVLKDRGNLIATIYSDNHSGCEDLKTFGSSLGQMRVVPFAGVSLVVYHERSCETTSQGSLDPSYNAILERLPFKNLSVQFRVDWNKCRDCSAIALVKKILEDFGGALEELSLDSDLEDVGLLRHVALNCRFPRLKTLKLESEVEDDDEDFTDFIKSMLSCAPNLLELHLGYLDLDENVLEGSSAVLVPSRFHFNPLYDVVGESVIGVLRPPRIVLQQQHARRGFGPEILYNFIPTVLEASRTALKAFRADLLFAVALMCYRICLENVTVLELRLEADLFVGHQSNLLAMLKGLDWSSVFPKLKKVEIDNDTEHSFLTGPMIAFVERENASLQDALCNRAIHIQHLVLRNSALDSTVPSLADIFPHVKTISVISLFNASPIPFTLLWDHFKSVKELEVEYTGDPDTVPNLDSVFCGIHPDEIAELRKEDDEYLKAVIIVPVMPSITCMRDLKKFTFGCTSETHNLERRDLNFILSKVTGFIAFARCPNLAVIFKTDSEKPCPEALYHMKPFATFTSVNFNTDDFD